MSEKLPFSPEQILDPEHELPAHALPERPVVAENLDKKAELARTEVEQNAESSVAEQNRIEQLEKPEAIQESAPRQVLSHELKAVNLNQMFRSIRRHESKSEQLLSRVVHQPAVRVISEATGKTISRPSGLLGGGLVALIGTTGYLLVAHHMGFRYNYFAFLALFVIGFAIGLILEFVVWLATSGRRHAAE